MRIGFYFGKEIYSDAKSGGAFTFTQSIFNQIRNIDSNHKIFIFSDDADKFSDSNSVNFVKINRFYSYEKESLLRKLILKIPRKILRIIQDKKYKTALNKIVLKHQIDLMWFATPGYEYVDVPYVYTIWDLQHRLQTYFPEVSKNFEFERREKSYNSIIPKAAFIIIGNKEGLEEISHFYNYTRERIKILRLPTPDFTLKNELEESVKSIDEKKIFYPAQFWPHKNHIVILYALKILKKKYNLNFKVIFTGSDKGNLNYIKSKIGELDLQDNVEIRGFVSIQELVQLYKTSFALVFPSFFGPDNIPPLEAFALSCPVIAAKVLGSEYQLKGAALLFDPKSEYELADYIKKLYDNEDLKNELIKKGINIAKSWTAKEYVDGIFKIVNDFAKIRRCWR